MRMHYSLPVSKLLHDLGEAGAEIRRAVEGLKINPYPGWAREMPETPRHFEFFVADRWIHYEVDTNDMENRNSCNCCSVLISK